MTSLNNKKRTYAFLGFGGIVMASLYLSWAGETLSLRLGLVFAFLATFFCLRKIKSTKGENHTFYPLMLLLFSVSLPLQAQIPKDPMTKRWGVEFSPVGAGVFRIAQAKATYALNPGQQFNTELGLGFLIQPPSTTRASEAYNGDGLYSANMASLAVRQYFWRGFHFEEVLNFGSGSISNSKVDGKDYDAFVVFTQTFLGYKFNLLRRTKFNLFIMGQAGFGYVPINTNQWPRVEESSNSIYGLGDLKLGINF